MIGCLGSRRQTVFKVRQDGSGSPGTLTRLATHHNEFAVGFPILSSLNNVHVPGESTVIPPYITPEGTTTVPYTSLEKGLLRKLRVAHASLYAEDGPEKLARENPFNVTVHAWRTIRSMAKTIAQRNPR